MSGSKRASQSRTASWVNSKPRSTNISARSRGLNVYRSRQRTTRSTMSVGYSRKLKGISVRSLKVRLQSEQRNIREPSEVLLLCSLVTPDHLRPFPAQTDTARRQGKQAAEHTAPCCRKHRLEEEAVTALTVMARENPTRGACSPFEGDQAGRLTLLASLMAQQGRPRKLTV